MKNSLKNIITIISINILFVMALNSKEAGSKDLKDYLSNLPFTMPEIIEPKFPDRQFNIVDYGAISDGKTLNTKSIYNAIQACTKAGGGFVIIPAGTWLTGSIKLESNVNLHLERGALLLFSNKIENFPLIAGFDGKSKKFQISPPISGYRLNNIAITGEGIIDGSGEAWRPVKREKQTPGQWKKLIASGGAVSADGKIWWPSKEALEGEDYLANLKSSNKVATENDYASVKEFLRPHMVQLVQSKNILIDGPIFRNSPKFHIYPTQSENIIVRNISIQTPWYAQNGDGLDLGSCRNVVVYNITVDAGDDAICIKPGNISSKQEKGPACENIIIADCIVYRGHGGFVIGSESYGGARNISVKNCIFIGTDVGLRFKSNRERGGLIENIFIENIQMSNIVDEAILFDMYYGEGDPEAQAAIGIDDKKNAPLTELTPRFQNFYIKNIICNNAGRAVIINGLPEMPVKNIFMENINLSADKGFIIIDADSIFMKNIDIRKTGGSLFAVNQGKNIFLSKILYPDDVTSFMELSGEKSENIQLENIDISKVKTDFIFKNKAEKRAIIIK
ncbi:MAG: glycoside hydrolase family 28 protein [Ignavibacteriales bacterium]|nr:glycoside hydrolase family 28 protein [Ignavibacteriales bacterium]